MRVALVTCREMPLCDSDLPILVAAFAARGACAEVVAWEDRAVDWRGFDKVIVRSTWNYLENLDAYLVWIDRVSRATELLNPPEILRWNLHKRYLIELANDGLPVVPTVLSQAGSDPDWDSLFERFGALVVKPAISAGSFATVRVARGDVVAARRHRELHCARDMLVQPYLSRVESEGERNMIHFGGRFSHAIEKGARWDGDGEQSRGLARPAEDELELAQHVLAACGRVHPAPLAYARIDVARDDAGQAMLMEAELVEPWLFLERDPPAGSRLVDAVMGRA